MCHQFYLVRCVFFPDDPRQIKINFEHLLIPFEQCVWQHVGAANRKNFVFVVPFTVYLFEAWSEKREKCHSFQKHLNQFDCIHFIMWRKIEGSERRCMCVHAVGILLRLRYEALTKSIGRKTLRWNELSSSVSRSKQTKVQKKNKARKFMKESRNLIIDIANKKLRSTHTNQLKWDAPFSNSIFICRSFDWVAEYNTYIHTCWFEIDSQRKLQFSFKVLRAPHLQPLSSVHQAIF